MLFKILMFVLLAATIAVLAGLYARLRRSLRRRALKHDEIMRNNAQLLAQAEQRARHLEFLNSVSKRAISSQDPETMLNDIVDEIQRHFNFDHIDVGVVEYASNEIVVRAEAGRRSLLGKRLSLGRGIIGQVAHTNQTALLQDGDIAGQLLSVIPDARSVLCVPLTYGDTLLGILNVESRRPNAFPPQEVLALNTFGDLLATALHNAFVFQKLQQQSITDSLTGIKTRRYFLEALQSEWKRASRSGRPFSLVMLDLDHLKDVNDRLGHLEGDLVLARVGRVLEQKCRHSNVVARYGGDEFVLLMPEASLEQAETLAERLRSWIEADPVLKEHGITGSFGVAAYPLHGATAQELLRIADVGMYTSKRNGGNRVQAAEALNEPEADAVQRQLLASYIEGFVQREQNGPYAVGELAATLRKLCATGGSSRESLQEAVLALALASEARELHTAGRGEATARYAELVARELRWDEDEIRDLIYAARVHDVGNIVVPENVLCKSAPLTPDEKALLQSHSGVGAQIVASVPDSDSIVAMVRLHHERFDGGGYPDGLGGDDIPAGARLLAVADAYVAMTTERPYAAAMSSAEALARLEARSGTQFDPEMVRALTAVVLAHNALGQGNAFMARNQ
jgi:diguanylate cyclase (GGDEF)-like protein